MNTLTIPANLDSLKRVADFVRAAVHAAGLGQQAGYRLRLAVDELVTNVVLYGYPRPQEPGEIELRAETSADALTVTIEDTGVAFDPSKAAPPDLGRPPEECRLGGLGIYLALESVDHYSYERRGDRNRSVLVVDRPRLPEA